MGRALDGYDLTSSQMKGLGTCFGTPGRVMRASKHALNDAGLSDDDVKDLVSKGYLEPLTSGDYLIPASVNGNAIVSRLRKQSNDDTIRQMIPGMFRARNS